MASFKSLNSRKFKTTNIPEAYELGRAGFINGLKAGAQCKELYKMMEAGGNTLDLTTSWYNGFHFEQMKKANESLVGFFDDIKA